MTEINETLLRSIIESVLKEVQAESDVKVEQPHQVDATATASINE